MMRCDRAYMGALKAKHEADRQAGRFDGQTDAAFVARFPSGLYYAWDLRASFFRPARTPLKALENARRWR